MVVMVIKQKIYLIRKLHELFSIVQGIGAVRIAGPQALSTRIFKISN